MSLVFCACDGFARWFVEGGADVCECGHPAGEHLDSVRVCLGTVAVYPAREGGSGEERAQAEQADAGQGHAGAAE